MSDSISEVKPLWVTIVEVFSWLCRLLKATSTRRRGSYCDELVSVQSNIDLKPVKFHRTHGMNIRLWINQQIAFRSFDFCHGYVFMPESMSGKESFVVVQVLEIDRNHLGSLAFGVTTIDPAGIRPTSLPSNTTELDDGNSYLVRSKITKSSEVGDVLIFYLNEKNEISVKVNGKLEETLFPIQKGVSYWWFFDLYGSTRKIRAYLADKSKVNMLGLRAQQPESFTVDCKVESEIRNTEVDSHTLTLNCYLSENGIRYEPVSTNVTQEMSAHKGSENTIIDDPSTGYCVECFQSPSNNCMLYPCGDLILCYDCATKLPKKHTRCPKCHLTIENATLIYR